MNRMFIENTRRPNCAGTTVSNKTNDKTRPVSIMAGQRQYPEASECIVIIPGASECIAFSGAREGIAVWSFSRPFNLVQGKCMAMVLH